MIYQMGKVILMDKYVEFYKHIGGLAIIYGKDLTKEALQVYHLALGDLSLEELKTAIKNYLNSQNAFFPTPGQLRGALKPSDDNIGQEVSSRILQAIQRYGGKDNEEKAKLYIGELGWKVVQRHGGWIEISRIEDNQLTSSKASWRNLAISLIQQDRLGVIDQPPMLPSSEKKLVPLSEILKLEKSK